MFREWISLFSKEYNIYNEILDNYPRNARMEIASKLGRM